MRLFFSVALLAALTICEAAYSGGVTRNFKNPAMVPNGPVRKIFELPNGQMLAFGKFTAWGNVTSSTGRLNTDGTLDSSFNAGAGFNANVYGWAQQSDSKIIATGLFTAIDGKPRNRIVRLNTNGSLDTSFNVGTGLNAVGNVAVVQADGKILVGGDFTSYNGTSINRIVRINTDGTIDTGFTVGTGFNGAVHDMVIQADGKIVVVGAFTTFNSTSRPRISRLNTDGTIDTGFTPGAGFSTSVWEVKLMADEKIVAIGDFVTYDSTSRVKVARVNTDGTLDTGFNPGTGITGGGPSSFGIQSDGKLIIFGGFNGYNGASVSSIVRVNTDGTRDATYPVVQILDYTQYIGTWQAWRMYALAGDKFLVCGNFTYVYGTNGAFYNNPGMVIYNSDGSVDASFTPGFKFHGHNSNCLRQSDGKIVSVGLAEQTVAASRRGLVRLNKDFTVDTGFDAGNWVADIDLEIFQLSVNRASNGKICIYGAIISAAIHGTTRNQIAVLNADGSLDTSFDPGSGFSMNSVYHCEILPDGKVLATGRFSSYRGVSRMRIARANADGTIDTGFAPAVGFSAHDVNKVIVDSNGKYVAVGWFTSYDGTSRNRIVRINTDATLDTSFDPGTGFNGSVGSIQQLPNGKYLVGGNFSSYNGTTRHDVALINQDGTLDTSLNSADNFSSVAGVRQSTDGKIWIQGLSGSTWTIRRLSATGAVEATSLGNNAFWVGDFFLEPSKHVVMTPLDPFLGGTFRPFLRRLKYDLRLDY